MAGSEKAQKESRRVGQPRDSEDDTDKNHHQGYSFPYFHHSLRDEMKSPVSICREKKLSLR